MAVDVIGNMAARLGLDPAEFLDKMKGVAGFNGLKSAEMARQWKKAGRDGQEGLRLIDEALGIHVARPVARIVAETFPAFSRGLSKILPGVAFTALGAAIFEFAERAIEKIQKAQRAQEEFREASEKVASTLDTISEGWGGKIADLQGRKGPAALNAEGAKQARKDVEDYLKVLDEAQKKQEAASGWFTTSLAAIGNEWHKLFASDSTRAFDEGQKDLKNLGKGLQDAFNFDVMNGTDTALKKIDADIANIHDRIEAAPFLASFADELPALKEEAAYLDTIKIKIVDMMEAWKKAKADADAKAMQKSHARELRAELEAIERLGASSRALAASEDLAAAATGKGTAESIQAAAAAEAQKKILDFLAEAESKFFSDSNRKIAATREFKELMASTIPVIRDAALAEHASRATGEYNRGIVDFNTRSAERITALNEEAEGHGKVAAAQARELAGLIPLQQKLDGLRTLYDVLRGAPGNSAAARPAIGPPTVDQDRDARLARLTADLNAARANVLQNINPKIQTAAFLEELHKIQDESKSLAGADVSPWAKIDAQIDELTRRAQLLPGQIQKIREALIALQGVKVAGEFDKLSLKIDEARADTAALAAGSPYAKIDAEVVKLTRDLGLNVVQQALVWNGLAEIQRLQNTGKVWGDVDSLNAGGAKLGELRQQMEALQRARNTGKSDDGMALSPEAIAAVSLEMQRLAGEEDKILLETGGVNAGFQAWLDSLQAVESEGKFVFDQLSQATKGFEDTAAKSLITILESHRNQHQKLIHELRQMWESYFAGLTQSALKHGLEKLMQPAGAALSGALNRNPKDDGTVTIRNAGMSSIPLFGGLINKTASSASGANLTAAGTALQSAAAQLIAAAATLRAASVMPTAGAGSGSGNTGDLASVLGFLPGRAGGGDVTPGQDYIVGEQGPELFRSPVGGAITPNSALKGGDSYPYYDLRNSVVTDDLLRKADGARMMAASEERSVNRSVAMSREIAQRSRPAR